MPVYTHNMFETLYVLFHFVDINQLFILVASIQWALLIAAVARASERLPAVACKAYLALPHAFLLDGIDGPTIGCVPCIMPASSTGAWASSPGAWASSTGGWAGIGNNI